MCVCVRVCYYCYLQRKRLDRRCCSAGVQRTGTSNIHNVTYIHKHMHAYI